MLHIFQSVVTHKSHFISDKKCIDLNWIALYCKDLKHIGHVLVTNICILLIYHSNLYVNALPGLDLNPGPAMDPCMNLFMKSCRQEEKERSEVAHPGQGANQNLGPLE